MTLEIEKRNVLALKEEGRRLGLDEDEIMIAIEGETDFIEVADRFVQGIGLDEAMIKAIKAYKDDLDIRIARLKARRERRRELLRMTLLEIGEKKIECPSGTVSITTPRDVLHITDETEIPMQFKETPPPKVDKRSLLAALKGGAEIPGAELGEGEPGIRIGVK